jgi:hypothetical protein
MRTREEIEKEQQADNLSWISEFTQRNTRLILEVLLDIRKLLERESNGK